MAHSRRCAGSCPGGIVRTMDGQTHDVGKWDMLIAHPPCTYLSNAGANRLRIKGIIQKERMKKARRAKAFFLALWEADCPRVAIENPIPGKIHRLPRYTQIVQPYMFGDPWMKTTACGCVVFRRFLRRNYVYQKENG